LIETRTGSKVVVTGDTTQTDLPPHVTSGLVDAIERVQWYSRRFCSDGFHREIQTQLKEIVERRRPPSSRPSRPLSRSATLAAPPPSRRPSSQKMYCVHGWVAAATSRTNWLFVRSYIAVIICLLGLLAAQSCLKRLFFLVNVGKITGVIEKRVSSTMFELGKKERGLTALRPFGSGDRA